VVALAVSELFLTSWIDALVLTSAKHSEIVIAAAPPPPPAESPSPSPEERHAALEVGVMGLMRGRQMGSPFITFQPTLAPAMTFGKLLNVDARDTHGIGGEAVLRAGPGVRFGVWHVGLGLSGGDTFPTLEGRVTNEEPVRLNGGWLGMGLSVGLEAVGL
jgi:hypothetical protein